MFKAFLFIFLAGEILPARNSRKNVGDGFDMQCDCGRRVDDGICKKDRLLCYLTNCKLGWVYVYSNSD